MDLHEFNPRVLNAIGIIDETGKGHLSRVLGENRYSPFMIGEKRVVLPTSEHLRSDDKGVVVYHPLSENITRGESDMIKSMRDQIMFKLTVISVQLISELGRVAATDSEHSRLDAASSKYLKAVSGMDSRSYDFLKKVILRIGPEPEKRLVSISLRKGNKDGVLRAAKFKFPVLDQLLTDEHELLGVKYPSKKARQNITALFEIVLGDAETRASYDYGSKNMAAPYFHALMMGFNAFATHLNDVIKKHKKLLGKAVDEEGKETGRWLSEDLLIDLSWVEGMDDLAEMRRIVPPQEGNEGAIIVAEAKDVAKTAEKLSARIAPATRSAGESRRDVKADELDLPFDLNDNTNQGSAARRDEPPARRTGGKSLDDYLSGGRDSGRDNRRDDRDRDDRWSRSDRDRDDRGSRWGSRDRDSRDDRRDSGGRRYNLGLDKDADRGRDERERDNSWSRQDFRREERSGSGRRPFGSGSQQSGGRGRF
ncbi:hypothetical protein D3C84_266300 [compost metagenome]